MDRYLKTTTIARRRLAASAALAALLVAAACASLPLKQRATLGVQAAHTAVAAAQDGERALYEAKLAGVTPQRHEQFSNFFARYFGAEEKVAGALIAWRAGDPVPSGLEEALRVLNETLTAGTALTDGAGKDTFLGHVRDGIAEIRRVLALVGGMGGAE